ncbi:hypothetical protein GUJ93_ZPchr0001g33030 [Zizania palustris]|uniref:Uncharacterized protein n=1 Tax=Zizania palustris TaxID=103762 RepID=A0A8J5V7E2_ZIZPA|nr:hypothetical protein GUJ93_ZPchr0001g33030 [Zizania palustris]
MEVEEDASAVAVGGALKRKRGGGGDGCGGEVMREDDDDDKEEEEAYEGIAEESVAELMRWLEMEISSAPGQEEEEELEADESPAAAPGFVTMNGNEESCGPSFSAASSTVMASVDTRAGAPPPPPVPWPFPPVSSSAAGDDHDDAAVAEFADEEWLVELLSSGPALQDEQLATSLSS